jgi:hypothetical protein
MERKMRETALTLLGLLVRHGLTALGTLIGVEFITEDVTLAIVGGIVAAVGLAWSVIEKRLRAPKIPAIVPLLFAVILLSGLAACKGPPLGAPVPGPDDTKSNPADGGQDGG